FGYSEGAFTDASRKGRKGLLELGQGGTVLLDEIGDMPLNMQSKLLTVLEDKVLRRIGSEKWNALDVRFVAATNRSVEALVEGKALRQDIYYRLAMNQIDIPPLRERPDDIPCLIDHALMQFNDKNGTNVSVRADVVRRLSRLPWQGNVRELNNLVGRMASESNENEGEVTWAQLSPELVEMLTRLEKTPGAISDDAASGAGHDAVEEERLRALCQQCEGDVYAMANILNLHRTTVIRKLRHHGIAYARKKIVRSYGKQSELIA
ncbi:MAG: sigma 54-interacting transcriptional regulator, partial [Sulfobacillus sp.]